MTSLGRQPPSDSVASTDFADSQKFLGLAKLLETKHLIDFWFRSFRANFLRDFLAHSSTFRWLFASVARDVPTLILDPIRYCLSMVVRCFLSLSHKWSLTSLLSHSELTSPRIRIAMSWSLMLQRFCQHVRQHRIPEKSCEFGWASHPFTYVPLFS